MFEIGWTEMLVIAVVMIVVVGPKDLPRMLRTFGRTTAKLRAMAGDFQKQFNEALKEAELDDVKKSVDSLRSLDPSAEIRKQLNPFEKAAADIRSGLDSLKPSAAPTAEAVTHAAEPLKNGPAALPEQAPPAEAVPAPKSAEPAPAEKAQPQATAASAAGPVKPAGSRGVAKAKPAAAKAKPAPKAAKTSAKPKAAPKPAAARKKPAGSTK
ncbi:Sec-independent protein translocase protein TatB [Mesorhizobium sp. 1B3]|uniref:Sec-independent protein translocase protein TatB n=1 Tax=Mesorhizobium sp. 1B3 TaxID=3243599 RepID=UPI003D9610A1